MIRRGFYPFVQSRDIFCFTKKKKEKKKGDRKREHRFAVLDHRRRQIYQPASSGKVFAYISSNYWLHFKNKLQFAPPPSPSPLMNRGGCCHGVSESFFFFSGSKFAPCRLPLPRGNVTVPPSLPSREIYSRREKSARIFFFFFFYSTEIIIGRYH